MGDFLKKIVIAVDSFKGSMSSMEAGKAVQAGFSRIFPECSMTVLPVADGGEGTVDAVTEGLGGEKVTVTVTGPSSSKSKSSGRVTDTLPSSSTAICVPSTGLPS